jgi:hypothetical protein
LDLPLEEPASSSERMGGRDRHESKD